METSGALSAARPPGFAAVVLIDSRPGAALGFLLAKAALFIAFGDMVAVLSCLLMYSDFAPRGMAFPLELCT
jgi:hypothetical protein